MAKLSRWLVSLACLATPLVSQAATYWSPHIGADYKYWGVHTSDFYEEVFPRMDNAFDVYVGTRINGFFGVDVGYEKSINVMKTHVFDTDDIIFAEAETPGNSTMIDLRLRSLYAEMNFYAESNYLR